MQIIALNFQLLPKRVLRIMSLAPNSSSILKILHAKLHKFGGFVPPAKKTAKFMQKNQGQVEEVPRAPSE